MNTQVSYYSRTLVLGVTAALATCLLALAFGAPPADAQEQTGEAVVAWGANYQGQSTVPTGLGSVKAIAAGESHSLALEGDGTVVAWGDNDHGQANVPIDLAGVTAISAAAYHSLALEGGGTVVAWGDNSAGQTNVPTGLAGVTAISSGLYHSLALKEDGTVIAWGDSGYGKLNVPTDLAGVTAIAAGGFNSLALKEDGTVVAWGSNDQGQSTVPTGLAGVKAIAAGGYHSLALKEDGTVVAWGGIGYGETNVPTGPGGMTAIDAGGYHSLAIRYVPPMVTSVKPQGNATGIASGTNVSAIFSEAMRTSSIINTVKLFKAGTTTALPATLTYDPTTKKATLNPDANLQRGARYKAVVTVGARDLAGNQLDQDQITSNGNQKKAWFFTVRN